MPFAATVLQVLVASPGDADRSTVRTAIEDWNALHAEAFHYTLQPVMWERDATPEMGDRPQEIINRQLGKKCDMLVGVFWARLGTPTSEGESGSVEEVNDFIEAGKPVLLYFCKRDFPHDADPDELKRVREFEGHIRERGLYDSYKEPSELKEKLTQALTRKVRNWIDLAGPTTTEARHQRHAAFVVRKEQEFKGLSKRGKAEYRDFLVIENTGTATAENLRIELRRPPGEERTELPTAVGIQEPVSKVAPGAKLPYPLLLYWGVSGQIEIVLRWEEAGESFEEIQSVIV